MLNLGGERSMAGGRRRAFAAESGGWLFDQPYLLLSLTSLFWAGNTVLGRFIAGHVPPITLAFIRWTGAFLILLPFAAPHLLRDWPIIRKHCGADDRARADRLLGLTTRWPTTACNTPPRSTGCCCSR